MDWLHPSEFEIDRQWTPEVARARMADAALLHVETSMARHLPRHAGEWLELLDQQTQRAVNYVDTPNPHIDWQATVSNFGSFPCQAYVERRPIYSYDTSFSRALKWTALSIVRADSLVFSKFGRHPLSPGTKLRLSAVLELPEVVTATDAEGGLSDFDIGVCRRSGGVWLVLARIAELLSGLWTGSVEAQLLGLRPILPDFAHQLFELGTLGTICYGLRASATNQAWETRAPLAASYHGRPSLSLTANEGQWKVFFQAVPAKYRQPPSPYVLLTRGLTGGPLRPDIWIEQDTEGTSTEMVFECKYSLNPSYVATGVTQSFAYEVEFPPIDGARRLHVVVGPQEVVEASQSWDRRFVVTNPSGARALCQHALQGELDHLLECWARGEEA